MLARGASRTICLGWFAAIALTPCAWAVGFGDEDPPPPTPSTVVCPTGQVWDSAEALCVDLEDAALDEDPAALIVLVRELAYAGRHMDALALLARAPDPEDTMVLTYLGYSTRSIGDMAGGMAYYDRAVAADPDNLLVRAYMGMAWLIQGRPDDARAQLGEIRARGGTGRWPERALAAAIAQGSASGFDY